MSIKPTDSELEILNILWTKGPSTVREIHEVLEQNKDLDGAPESVNTDPYGKGWIVKIEITNAAELDGLLDAEAYKKHIGV